MPGLHELNTFLHAAPRQLKAIALTSPPQLLDDGPVEVILQDIPANVDVLVPMSGSLFNLQLLPAFICSPVCCRRYATGPSMMFFLRHPLPRCRQLAGRLFRAMAYFSVLLSLWQAPLPWLHCHSSGHDDQATQLTHIAAYHSGIEQQRTWHLHFAPLSDIVLGGGCPVPTDEESRDRESLQTIVFALESSADSSRLLPAGSWLNGIRSFALADTAATLHSPGISFRDRHPLNRFASSGGLLPLLCICRC